MRGQHQAAFHGFRHHFGGAGGTQLVKIGIVVAAHDHRQCWRQLTYMMQHFQGGRRAGIGDHQGGGAMHASCHQAFAARGVAIGNLGAGRTGVAHAIGIEIQCVIIDALFLQQLGQALAAAAETGDDHVLLGGHGARRNLGQGQRLHHPFAGRQFHHDRVGFSQDERRRQHRQHHGCQDQLDQQRIDQLQAAGLVQQHEAELPGLRQRQSGAQRDAGG